MLNYILDHAVNETQEIPFLVVNLSSFALSVLIIIIEIKGINDSKLYSLKLKF